MAIIWVTLFKVFCFWGLKIRDRIQTIPFKVIAKASLGPEYRGSLVQGLYFLFFLGPVVGGGGANKIKHGATLLY